MMQATPKVISLPVSAASAEAGPAFGRTGASPLATLSPAKDVLDLGSARATQAAGPLFGANPAQPAEDSGQAPPGSGAPAAGGTGGTPTAPEATWGDKIKAFFVPSSAKQEGNLFKRLFTNAYTSGVLAAIAAAVTFVPLTPFGAAGVAAAIILLAFACAKAKPSASAPTQPAGNGQTPPATPPTPDSNTGGDGGGGGGATPPPAATS